MSSNKNQIVLFGLSNGAELAKKISKLSGIDYSESQKEVFADGEIMIRFKQTVRGRDVFVVQSTAPNIHENIFELLIFMDALKRASAKTINIIIPYYAYARQDRKSKSHEPITSKMMASIYELAGATRIVTFDLHAPQIEGYFDIPVDNLSALPTLCNFLWNKKIENLVIVAPDQGGVVRARRLAEAMSKPLAIIDKRRVEKNVAEVMNVLGNVKDKNCVLIDDMIDTGGTIVKGCEALKKEGAKSIFVVSTHPVFSGPAVERLSKCEAINEVIVTDTIPLSDEKLFPKLKIASIAGFLSDVIKASINCEGVGKVYREHTKLFSKPWD